MTIIGGVRDWLKRFDGFADGRINVDFLPDDAKTYSVDAIPAKEVIKKYMDGSSVRQFLFAVSSREFNGGDILQSLDNHAFYESLSAWLERQCKRRDFPQIGENRRVQAIEISSTAYPFVVDDHGTARYQLQLRLTYFQKGER